MSERCTNDYLIEDALKGAQEGKSIISLTQTTITHTTVLQRLASGTDVIGNKLMNVFPFH